MSNSRQRVGWLVAELIVVFIGVSLAFLLDEYRANRVEDEKRRVVHNALFKQFSELSQGFDGSIPMINSIFARFLDAYEQGEMPMPRTFVLVVGKTQDMWDAALQVGGLEVMDVNLMFRIVQLYGTQTAASALLERFDRLSAEILVPNLDKGKDEFYDLQTRRLRKRYDWYPDYLQRIQAIFQEMHGQLQDLVEEMGQS